MRGWSWLLRALLRNAAAYCGAQLTYAEFGEVNRFTWDRIEARGPQAKGKVQARLRRRMPDAQRKSGEHPEARKP